MFLHIYIYIYVKTCIYIYIYIHTHEFIFKYEVPSISRVELLSHLLGCPVNDLWAEGVQVIHRLGDVQTLAGVSIIS